MQQQCGDHIQAIVLKRKTKSLDQMLDDYVQC